MFARNFGQLVFKLDGETVPTKHVKTALPARKKIIVFEFDDKGQIVLESKNKPKTKELTGAVEIIGKPQGCNCSMRKYLVQGWWSVQ